MPAKRKYNIKGTNDFLVLAAIFFFLCLWAIKDAWFPSDKVLKKHPSEITASFSVAGSVEKVHVRVGDSVGEKQLLAKLRSDRLSVEYEAAKETYTASKKAYAKMQHELKSGGAADATAQLDVSKTAMEEALEKVTALRISIDASELHAESKGVVKEVKVGPHSMVDAGEVALVIDPKDHFYLFNKSLAIFSFFAFWIFLAIHILAR